MIELPICCKDLRRTPPGPLVITYETDFMLPPQKQILELHGQPEFCADCAITWEIRSGPGILAPNYGTKVIFEIPEGAMPTWMNGLGETVIELYCIDYHLQTLKILSQCWSYSIFEDWEKELSWCRIVGLKPPPLCSTYARAHVHRYNCFGKLVVSRHARSWYINREVEDCGECPGVLEETKEVVLKDVAELPGYIWKIPRDHRTQRAIDLGCKGFYKEPGAETIITVEVPGGE